MVSFCKASEFKFGVQRSTDWQFVGRKVQFSLTMDIPESTPLKAKIKLPFNETAVMRLTEVKYTYVSDHLSSSVNTTTLTSSANDGLNDIALFELGNVTRASFGDNTEVKIEFEVQVLNHAHIVNGGPQWVSVGTEYKNYSVWAAQLAVTTINPATSRPHLKVDFWPDIGGYDIQTGEQIKYRLRLSHSDLTTEEVVSGIIEWPLPPVLSFNTYRKVGSSINVEVVNTPEMVTIKFGQLKFEKTVDFEVTFDLDSDKTKADGKIHDLTTHVNVRYNGSVNSCGSSSGSREFTNDGSATASIKYYVKQVSCDAALGLEDGSIANEQITASSYASGAEPSKGRLSGDKAWIPYGLLSEEKHQFFEVNFTSKVKIRRLSMKGQGKNFVRTFHLYYSNNGAIWTPYKEGSKLKEFVGNKNADYGTSVILPVPIEAVFVRINPTSWENNIALKVEFYGCKLNQPLIPGPLKFTSRGYLLDKTTDCMHVHSVPMDMYNKVHASSCFCSCDRGTSWKLMHHGVIAILGYDPVETTLYGVSRNGKAVFKITIDQSCESSKPAAVPQNVWDTAKAKDTTIVAVMLENDFAITNTTITPLAEHTITSNSGTKWGVSGQGVHVEESSEWKLKAIWKCTGP